MKHCVNEQPLSVSSTHIDFVNKLGETHVGGPTVHNLQGSDFKCWQGIIR